ncbi:hypothetical protein FGAF374_09880 [Escherichia coli]|nr:hypothetical protein ExPECSC048_03818 [Escherichia coli]CAK0667046.1 hypothetical protein FGAF1022_21490 [Escherichia coli]CAK0670094.1 hypothetical protein FGAF374_09880 [Escherichia coli]SRB28787.1 Uncharacterised protein [Escherichia coli]
MYNLLFFHLLFCLCFLGATNKAPCAVRILLVLFFLFFLSSSIILFDSMFCITKSN